MNQELIKRFCAIVGDDNVLCEHEAIRPYLIEPRGFYHAEALLVLRPNSTQQVSEIMALASQTRTAIVPQGGNTGLVGAQQPEYGKKAVILSLARFNKIRSIDVDGNFIIAEAGVVLQQLQQAACDAGRLFPLSIASQGSCQIGGNLSSNAGGTAVLSYGNSRELCMGLEVVLPDGRVLDDLRFVKKDNSGYDLKDLFIGAEGTLGVITAAVLKLFPQPKGKAVAFVGLANPEQALTLLRYAQERFASCLSGFELIASLAMQISLQYTQSSLPLSSPHGWYVLLEVHSNWGQDDAQTGLENFLAFMLDRGVVGDATVAQNIEQQQHFWQLRENMSPAQKRVGHSIKHDIAIPIAAIPAFIKAADDVVQTIIPDARVVCFGHMGDGNLHYNVSQPEGADGGVFLKNWNTLNHHIHKLVVRYHGAFSAEHGIGQLKRDELLSFKSPVALDIMRGIKQLFDPLGIMNPDKILKNSLSD